MKNSGLTFCFVLISCHWLGLQSPVFFWSYYPFLAFTFPVQGPDVSYLLIFTNFCNQKDMITLREVTSIIRLQNMGTSVLQHTLFPSWLICFNETSGHFEEDYIARKWRHLAADSQLGTEALQSHSPWVTDSANNQRTLDVAASLVKSSDETPALAATLIVALWETLNKDPVSFVYFPGP